VRYLALAVDYDGTLAHHGRVDEPTLAALGRLLASGRKLIMVTGRRIDDLAGVFEHQEWFEWIVAENGAILYKPSTRQSLRIAEPPPPKFVDELRRRGVAPIDVGEVIVATWQPHEAQVLEAIRDLGLELQIIFNKGAVMVLPGGINKAVGLSAALVQMQLSPHNVVAVGDAENDHAFLSVAECSVAVANALDSVKKQADLVTAGDHGRGVTELIDKLVADDLKELEPRLTRHQPPLNNDDSGQ
jgi:hydroxymethylpyrimidine pyrophosphatase-like HAD family hydrolase